MTPADREQIAAGLAAGLEYAEIARRLNRPTSTVTREVARNSGPHGYRADLATRATHARARRRKPVLPAVAPLDDNHGRDATAVAAFEEQFVAMVVETGLQRMAARVLARLYLTDSGSLTAADLAQSLRVSPASISKAVAYLEGIDLLQRKRDTRRRERYVVDDDFQLRAWTASTRTNAMWASASLRGAEILGPHTPAGARLEYLGQFFERLHQDMLNGVTAATVGDALTVLAALVHAGRPLSAQELATALGWTADRVGEALRSAADSPGMADPVALRHTETGAYDVIARPERLTTRQREALSSL
ncbi:MarR family protein [Actinocrispum wychmicini]|uniref:MarR family protein n=1 Tax=Actinocrispum wychmicini TaxID=1213861 RepID=A0A4R2J8K5_9PSEU|nr:MarR family protein [Actinocrispum wychmicini]